MMATGPLESIMPSAGKASGSSAATATLEISKPKASSGPPKSGSDARTAIAGGGASPAAKLAAGTAAKPTTQVSEVTGVWGPGNGPKPGAIINQYELIRELGAGGMGTVYLARDTKLGRKVAIKILNSNHPELTQRFIVEARATARCSHENIVIIYEVGEFAAQPYMVLEFLQGSVLTDLVHGGKRLPAGRTVELMVPVARALACAHEQGIVHRDLKPDNIFVTETGTVKVLDFTSPRSAITTKRRRPRSRPPPRRPSRCGCRPRPSWARTRTRT